VVGVPLASYDTPYRRLGDWVPVTAFVILGAAVGCAYLRWHRVAGGDTLRG
jgi:apolipoprotein N-acyltransferase